MTDGSEFAIEIALLEAALAVSLTYRAYYAVNVWETPGQYFTVAAGKVYRNPYAAATISTQQEVNYPEPGEGWLIRHLGSWSWPPVPFGTLIAQFRDNAYRRSLGLAELDSSNG